MTIAGATAVITATGVTFGTASHAQAAEVLAGVATEEANVVVEGTSYTMIRANGREFLLKVPRAGSVLAEVRCRGVDSDSTQDSSKEARTAAVGASSPKTEPATRAKAFIDQLTDGCANGKQSFTFEQRPNHAAAESQRVRPPSGPEKPATARSLSPELDPHVLPDSFGPDVQTGKQF